MQFPGESSTSGTDLRYMITKTDNMGDKQEDLEIFAQLQGYHLSEVTKTEWDSSQLECCSVWIQALHARQAGMADYQ